MKRGPSGTILSGPSVGGETVRAFVPGPLPPAPSLVIDATLREEIDQALLALGRLDSVSSLLPDTRPVMKQLIDDGKVKTKGERRGMAYFVS